MQAKLDQLQQCKQANKLNKFEKAIKKEVEKEEIRMKIPSPLNQSI